MQIIAESGGTKTDWRFLSDDGKIEQYVSAGLNPTYTTNTEMLNLLKASLNLDLKEPVQSIHFYGAGCHGQQQKEKVKSVLSSFFVGCKHIVVNHDLLAAARACSIDRAAIICILGTGSNACYYDGENIAKQMVNLGFILGDEGSGAHLGKKLMKDYFEERLPNELKLALTEQFPSLDRDHLIEHLYRQEKPNKYLAHFFPFILDHQHTPYCQQMIIASFEAFLDRVLATFDEAKQLPLHFVGGVAFHANPLLRRVLQKKELNAGIIIESPIAGLTLYHQKNP